MQPIECLLRGRHPGSIHGAANWGIAASVGEGVPQRSNVGSKARDTSHRLGRRVFADLRRDQDLGAGVAHLLVARGCDA